MTEARKLLVLAALVAATSCLSLFHPIQDVDPAQYAGVAQNVALHGGWLNLRDARGPFINKPPLMIWAQALVMRVVPNVSVAARVPALLFGALALWALFLCGRALYDEKTAALAVALFAAMPAFHLMIADPKVDMPLVAFTTLAVWAFIRGGRRAWLGWLFVALAVLSKGPIGLVLVLCAMGPVQLRSRRPVGGLLLVGALCAPFYVALAAEHGASALGRLLWDSGPGRLFDSSLVHDGTTPLFFLHTGLWALAPVSPVLVIALFRGPRGVPFWWFVLPFLIISFSSIKMPQYVFWLAPAAALLAAREWKAWMSGLTAVAVAGAGVLLLVWCFPAPVWVLAVWLACGAVAFAMSRPGAVAAMGAFFVLFHGYVHGELLNFQAGEPLGLAVRAADPNGIVVPYLGAPAQYSTGLYAARQVCEADAPRLRELVQRGDAHVAVVTDEAAQALQAQGFTLEMLTRVPGYPTSRPTAKFMNAATRESTLAWLSLVEIRSP